MLVIKREESNFVKEHISEGTQQMVISGVFDLGLQRVKKWNTVDETVLQQQILFMFESTEQYEHGNLAGKPKKIFSRKFPFTMGSKSNLYSFIKALFGEKKAEELAVKGFDFYKLLGHNVLVTVSRGVSQTTGKDFDYIENYASLPKNIEKIEPVIVVKDIIEEIEKFPEIKWIKELKEIGRKNLETSQEQEASDELDDILNDEPVAEVAKSTKTAPVKTITATEPVKARNMAAANREKRDAAINEIFGDEEEEASDLPINDSDDAGDFL